MRGKVKRLAASLFVLTLLASCGQNNAAMPSEIAEAALVAARSGNLELVRSEGVRLAAVQFGSCTGGRLSRHRSHAIDKLAAIAAFYGSDRSAIAAGNALSERLGVASVDHPEDCDRAAIDADMEAAISSIDAEGFRVFASACSVMLRDGPALETLVAIARGDQPAFRCEGAKSGLTEAIVKAHAERQLEGSGIMHLVNPLWCVKGTNKQTNFQAQYLRDIDILGQPEFISVSKSGVAARWPFEYELFGSVEPNLVRRTMGSYPANEDIQAMTLTNGEYFADSAVEEVRAACLSEQEISRILVNHVNSN